MNTDNNDEDLEIEAIINADEFTDASDRDFNTSIAHERIPNGIYVYSHNPPCREDADEAGDYSECKELRVDLPLGAQIVEVRLVCKMLRRNGGKWKIVKAGKDLAWARFKRVKITNLDQNTSVTTVFKNWSHVHTREARLEVDWRLPR
jgi:hypothetical protein